MRASTPLFNNEPSGHFGLGSFSNCCSTSMLRSIRQLPWWQTEPLLRVVGGDPAGIVRIAPSSLIKDERRPKEIAECTRPIILYLQWSQH